MSHTTPLEFALWLNGAAGLIGDEPPTAEQWTKIREKLNDVVAGVVASRLLEDAQHLAEQREAAAKRSQLMREALQQAMGAGASINNGATKGTRGLGLTSHVLSDSFFEALHKSHDA